VSTTAPTTGGWALSDAFDRAAPTYDAMVALSPGYHEQLLGAARSLLERLPAPDGSRLSLLDLGCGSGASTQALLEEWRASGGAVDRLTVTGVDMSEGMVAQARAKSWPTGVELVISDAVAHLEALPADSVDGILACYLLRNVPDRERLVREMTRVLRPGGALVVHDYSVKGSIRARAIWAGICHGVIIPLAVVKGSDVPLHRYLYTSVRDFDSVARICERLLGAGLVDVRHRTYAGWQRGVVHTVGGSSPS
jgi:ubiquinone/menaquinone biosynthesis C-methylase UbiE